MLLKWLEILSTMEKNHEGCMVLDDEADDIDYSNFQSVGAERIPMKMIENLYDIWVPAHLLQNRKNFANIHLSKPAVFRTTLEKPEKSFSVFETETQDQPEHFSAADIFSEHFSQEDMLDLLNKSKNSETLTLSDKEINDYVKSACLKTFIQTSDENVRNSSDDIYDSDDEFCEEARCTMSEEVLNEKCDNLVEPLNISETKSSKSMDVVEEACCNPDFESSLQTDSLKGSMVDCGDPKELDELGDTDVVNFPIAYKRPIIKEIVKKQKNQKKKKNAQKKTVLDVFTQKEDSECPYPKVDEFYESVMSREYERVMSREYDQPYEYQYPSLKNEFPDLNQNFTSSEVTSKFEEFIETENLVEDNATASLNLRKPTNDSLGIKGVNIVFENVPTHVSEKQVQDLLTIGEVRSLYLSKCGQFKIAEISMENDTDAEWMIDCYNGSTPFGAGSSTLKCYKLS